MGAKGETDDEYSKFPCSCTCDNHTLPAPPFRGMEHAGVILSQERGPSGPCRNTPDETPPALAGGFRPPGVRRWTLLAAYFRSRFGRFGVDSQVDRTVYWKRNPGLDPSRRCKLMARKKPVDGALLSLGNRLKSRGPKALRAWAGKHPEALDFATVGKMAGAASDGRDPLLAEAAAVLAGVLGDAALEAECLLTAGVLRGAMRQSARASRQLRRAFDLYLGLRDFGNAAAALEAEVDAWIRARHYERGFRCGLGLLERIAAEGDAPGSVEACVRLAWCLFGYRGYEDAVRVCEAAPPTRRPSPTRACSPGCTTPMPRRCLSWSGPTGPSRSSNSPASTPKSTTTRTCWPESSWARRRTSCVTSNGTRRPGPS